MGIGKRLFDIARANLNALLASRKPDEPSDLEQFSDEELESELQLRQDRRRRSEQARAAREAAERAARERRRQQAARQAAPTGEASPGSRATSRPGGANDRGMPPGSDRSQAADSRRVGRGDPPQGRLAVLYARLETPYGADLATLKRNFRRLMRKYHPDLVGGPPSAQRAATEVTKELTTAYNELEQYLVSRRA